MKRLISLAVAILVSVAGPASLCAQGTPAAAPAAAAAGDARAPARAKIDINTASEEELATLHGIGEARARAIVAGRPYKAKDELARRKIVPRSVYDRIKDRIVAHRK